MDSLSLLVCLLTVYAIFMVRNTNVYLVRVHLLRTDVDVYERLPNYHAMVLLPHYWRLWTAAQWARNLTTEAA